MYGMAIIPMPQLHLISVITAPHRDSSWVGAAPPIVRPPLHGVPPLTAESFEA